MRKHSKQGNQPAAESAYRRKRGNGIISVAIILMFALILQGCQLRTLETSTNDPISSTDSTSDHASTEDSTTSKTEDTSQSEDTTQSDSETISDTTSESESSTEQSDTTEDTSNTEQTNQPTTTKRQVQTTTKPPSTTAAPTTTTTTAAPTTTTTAAPTTTTTAAPKPSGGSFPYKNYGAFFRDNYGSNANHVVADYGDIITVTLDVGSTPNGVALVKVDKLPGSVQCVVQLSKDGSMYQYHLNKRGTFVGIPLQMGNGTYQIAVAYNAGDGTYPAPLVHSFSVSLASSLKPYTASSIISDFSYGSSAVATANSLAGGQSTLDGKIDAVYNWITKNISYNRSLASQITNGQVTSYLPNPDQTMSTRTGICYDYASLMCAMLRSQGIATRMLHGKTPQGYHAWNEVYMDGVGWVVVAGFSWNELSGGSWVRFDTTFAAGGMSSQEIKDNSYSITRVF